MPAMRQDKVRRQNKKTSLVRWLSENKGGSSKSKAIWFDVPVPICDKFDYSLTVDSWTFSETSFTESLKLKAIWQDNFVK
jgi:hypothetical protein